MHIALDLDMMPFAIVVAIVMLPKLIAALAAAFAALRKP